MKFRSCLLIFCLVFYSCHNIESPGELIPPYSDFVKEENTEYLEVLIYGDAGKGSPEQQWTADEMSVYVSDVNNDIDFIINLGDSFYEEGVTSVTDSKWNSRFESVFDPAILNMPFFSILGNHDYRGNIDAQLEYISPFNDRWQMPSRYYSVKRTLPDSTEIEFLLIDTESLLYGDAEQLNWIADQLKNSTARWKIVAGHRPLFSYGAHGFNGSLIPRMQPILNNKADIFISGHEHDIQILGPLNEVYYIISGSAGASRNTGIGDLTVFATNRIGFITFLISYNQIICRVIESNSGVIYSSVLLEKS